MSDARPFKASLEMHLSCCKHRSSSALVYILHVRSALDEQSRDSRVAALRLKRLSWSVLIGTRRTVNTRVLQFEAQWRRSAQARRRPLRARAAARPQPCGQTVQVQNVSAIGRIVTLKAAERTSDCTAAAQLSSGALSTRALADAPRRSASATAATSPFSTANFTFASTLNSSASASCLDIPAGGSG